MIKLIASDIDGTLLRNGATALDPVLFDLIRQLKEKGILFVAASGRQHTSIENLFEPVKDDIAYICENGALCLYNGEVISTATVDRDIIFRALEEMRKRPNCEAAMSCQDCCYLESKDEKYIDYIVNGLGNTTEVVDDLTTVKDDILKFAILDNNTFDESYEHFCRLFGDEIKIVTAGNDWFDFVSPDSNKGLALERMAELLGFSASECVAFGDQYNDVEMLQFAGTSYAMEKAAPGISDYADHVTDSVEKILQQILDTL